MTPTILDCLDGPDGCDGPVEWRHPLTTTGASFPRCERHWAERLERQERISVDYPDTPIPPAWFDPTLAGEKWSDDE